MNAWLRGFKKGLFAVAALPLPLAITLHDGDLGESQVFLTTAPPHSFEYRCKEWEIEERRDGHVIELRLLGLVTHGDALHSCAIAKDPIPIESRMATLTRPGVYQLEFTLAPQSDRYRLEVTEGSISLEPEGKPALTQAQNAGKYLRVPDDWLFVDVKFMDKASRKKLSSARSDLLKAVAALGAREFEPAQGTYLFGETPLALPAKNPTTGENGSIAESYVFHYTGDFTPLDQLMVKFAKHTRAAPGKPYMAAWTRNRTHVSSTYMHAN